MQEISKEVRKRMIRELQQYWDNKKKLERLERDIIDSTPTSDGQPRSTTTSDTTAQKALKLVSTRSILYCRERIQYIENIRNQLNDFEKNMFNKIFKDKCNWKYCEANYNISKNTYYAIFNKCIYLLAKEWGEI